MNKQTDVMNVTRVGGLAAGCLLLVLACTMGGCTTINPYTGEQQLSKSSIGAGTGVVAGALLGQALGGNTASTLIGAGLGGVMGGVIGNQLDQQDAQLRKVLQGSGVQVYRNGNSIRLIMPGNITFEHDRADIRSNFYQTLNSIAIVLAKYNNTVVRITGYASSVGDAMYNQRLSEQRANAVASYLIAQGVSSGRVAAKGMGARNPIASNSTRSGQEQNRRVEINITQM